MTGSLRNVASSTSARLRGVGLDGSGGGAGAGGAAGLHELDQHALADE
jgi:hypothetical protein